MASNFSSVFLIVCNVKGEIQQITRRPLESIRRIEFIYFSKAFTWREEDQKRDTERDREGQGKRKGEEDEEKTKKTERREKRKTE